MLTRRGFNLGVTSAAFGGLALSGCYSPGEIAEKISRIPKFRESPMKRVWGHGQLETDPEGLLDLPKDFKYRKISCAGDIMDDDRPVPDCADGMGSFRIDNRLVALVRNHELDARSFKDSAFPQGARREGLPEVYDWDGAHPLCGGTTTIVYDYQAGKVEGQYLSLAGTIRNCAGGATPWGSWLTCEEDFGHFEKDHGFVFDVPARHAGLVHAKALTHLGRFEHEAIAIDCHANIAYLTEDQVDSLFYRYVPPDGHDARRPGGKLQALAFANPDDGTDSSNWGREDWAIGEWRQVTWRTLDCVASAKDDLRKRGRKEQGALRFVNGEGIHFDRLSGEIYFACTSGGHIKSGQIMRYRPESADGGQIQIFLESTDHRSINFGDNLVVAPNGHLIVCEDPYFGGERNYLFRPISEKLKIPPPCYLRGITPDGELYDIARLHGGSELAGVCFAPDGQTLFVNVMEPAKTLAICGPWGKPRPDWSLYQAGNSVLDTGEDPPVLPCSAT